MNDFVRNSRLDFAKLFLKHCSEKKSVSEKKAVGANTSYFAKLNNLRYQLCESAAKQFFIKSFSLRKRKKMESVIDDLFILSVSINKRMLIQIIKIRKIRKAKRAMKKKSLNLKI